MKNFILFLLSVIFLISCSKTIEQLRQESDKIFNQALDYYDRGYLSQAVNLFEEVIKIETKIGNIQRRANSFVYLGLINYQLSDFIKSLTYYENALKDFRSLNDKKSELLVLNNIAGIYSLLGNYDRAIEMYSDVIGKSLLFADKESEAIASLNLGDVFYEVLNFDKAFDYYSKAYNAYEIQGDLKGKIFTLNKIGELFIVSKNFPNAIKSFDMAFELLNKNKINYLTQELYNNIGLVYFNQKQLSKAKEFFELALNLSPSTETNQLILIAIRNNLGDCEFQSGSFSKAIEYYKDALNLSEQSFLKFLSPLLQLKIGKSYEKLYFVNENEADKNQAERFLQFAVHRFQEIRDEVNYLKALTSIASFYTRIGEHKKTIKTFEKLKQIKLNFSLKPDDHLKVFALKPDYELSFIHSLIEHKKLEDAYRFIHFLKIRNLYEYFLRFYDFNFLEEHKEILRNLKEEILLQNTYQQILKEELALPEAQRIKQKLNLSQKNVDEISKKIQENLETLSNSFTFLRPITYRKGFGDLIKDEKEIFIDFLVTEDNLFCFVISKNEIFAQSYNKDVSSLLFNFGILLKNIDTFSLDEVIDFSTQNLSWLIDDVLTKVSLNFPKTEKLQFLVSGSELDFTMHLLYSSTLKSFLSEKFEISYSYLISEAGNTKTLNNILFLSDGKLTEAKDNISQTERDKPAVKVNDEQLKQKKRVGLRNDFKIPEVQKAKDDFKNYDGLIILDRLFLSEVSPELIYFQSQKEERNLKGSSNQKIFLKEILEPEPNFIFIKSMDLVDKKSLMLFLSLYEFLSPKVVLLPLSRRAQEISNKFLYNYSKRVENKNLNQVFELFFERHKDFNKELAGYPYLHWICIKN